MTELPNIPTQPEPEAIARAGDLLEALLDADLDVDACLAIGAALTALYDVHPPYPPRPEARLVVEPSTGVQLALEALARHEPTSVAESIRIGLVARELHPLLDRQ